ncbi:MAG: protein kinase, partial [Kofleriaceae bacterium]
MLGGRYRILALLGAGGMGSVYRVHDLELDEVVALKIVGPLDPFALARFRDEVRLARRVTHPNVARTFDIGEHGEVRFLTMEYVAGASLRRVLAREDLAEPTARQLALAICEACIAIHDAEVIHGDLKPENVVVSSTGRVKVSDFGLATIRGGDAAHVGGTALYMAPEQHRGAPADQRSDLYALGIILHELFGGKRPAGAAPSLRLPADVRAIIARCLDPDPARALGTSHQLAVHAQPVAPGARVDGVDAIVEGHVRRTGDQLQLALRVVSQRDGYLLWGRTMTVGLVDVIETTETAALAIAAALGARTTARTPSTIRDPRLVELYLKARDRDHATFHDHDTDNAELYREILDEAPDDPLILASYARALIPRGLLEPGAIARAQVIAERAIALAPELAEAQLAVGLRLFIGNDVVGAIRAIVRGLALAPSSAFGQGLLGHAMCELGELERGLGDVDFALTLEPDHPMVWANA